MAQYRLFAKVYDINFGWGEITEVAEKGITPVEVTFEDGTKEYYTLDGKVWPDRDPVLTFKMYKIPEEYFEYDLERKDNGN